MQSELRKEVGNQSLTLEQRKKLDLTGVKKINSLNNEEFIVVTESGILVEMEKRLPAKRFIPAPTIGSEGGCNECHYMKMVTLENILSCLENESPEIAIDEHTRKVAERSILNMVAIK